ncbi:hypothetical protein EVAR_41261_1 [Eumeta japonica]|uniref:Uncharacterized protein n=1 Tax=Eumeta variegata TaxID=151549 RepID=A0A4C1W605_EUMVA|nr:hypothetical protein EVAR_41261_1 [Eumeta japonica]
MRRCSSIALVLEFSRPRRSSRSPRCAVPDRTVKSCKCRRLDREVAAYRLLIGIDAVAQPAVPRIGEIEDAGAGIFCSRNKKKNMVVCKLTNQFTCRLCAAAVSLILGRFGRWSGREIARTALSLARSAQAERDNESCFFERRRKGRGTLNLRIKSFIGNPERQSSVRYTVRYVVFSAEMRPAADSRRVHSGSASRVYIEGWSGAGVGGARAEARGGRSPRVPVRTRPIDTDTTAAAEQPARVFQRKVEPYPVICTRECKFSVPFSALAQSRGGSLVPLALLFPFRLLPPRKFLDRTGRKECGPDPGRFYKL